MSSTRQRLIDTAFELFGRSGFHAVGLDRILEEVGVSKQTFYNHFESKDDLILAVLDHRHQTQDKYWSDLLQQIAGDDPRAKLYAVFDALETWFSQPDWRGCIFMTAAAEFPTPQEPAHQKAAEHQRLFREKLQYLATLAGAHDPAALGHQLTVLIEGIIAYRHVSADPRAVEIGREIGNMLLEQHLPSPAVTALKPPTLAPGAVA